MENKPITCDRFIVFLDIMGFKDRVARNTHEALYNLLTAFNKDLTNIINSSRKVAEVPFKETGEFEGTSESKLSKNLSNNRILLAQFSDSIVLFTTDDSMESLEELTKATNEIMRTAIQRDTPIPLKGALAHGKVTYDFPKQLFFGQAIIDAYLLEENVHYYGVVVHHTAEKFVTHKSVKTLFKDEKIPLKSGFITHYHLTWYKDNTSKAIEGLNRARLNVSDSPRKYIDNTITLIK